MKTCFKCGKSKEEDEFYIHPFMTSGRLNKCKECCKEESKEREHRLRNNPEWSEKERERAKEKYHRLNYRDRQYESNKGKPYVNSVYKNLHRKMNLVDIENSHHWNYKFPDDVVILKKNVHRFIHRYLILDKNSLCFKTVEGTLLDTKEKHLEYIENLIRTL